MKTYDNPDSFTEFLPDRSNLLGMESAFSNPIEDAECEFVQEQKEKAENRAAASELARIRARRAKQGQSPEEIDANSAHDKKLAARIVEADKTRSKTGSARPVNVRSKDMVNVSNATTPVGVQKLLNSLNINLDVQLTRTDTMNLLATLLTCNEQQLWALYNNKKVPISIKTVIKRLLDDSKLGNIDTIEKLWDRIFGKNNLVISAPASAEVLPGIIPGQPISREAYMVIRETIIGK